MNDFTNLHLNIPRPQSYHVFMRMPGCRNWDHISQHRTRKAAFKNLGERFAATKYKRGRVTMWQEWYGHTDLAEIKR